MLATWSGSSENRIRSKLAAIRSGLTDFGITVIPCSRCQRNTTCAGVTPCALAMSTSTGSERLVPLSGLYPSTATPRSVCAASRSGPGRAPRYLVDRRGLAGHRGQPVDLGERIVAHPDRAHPAAVPQVQQFLPD